MSHKPMRDNKKEKILESDVELIEGKGTKKHGGGKRGYYWHVYYKGKRAGRVYINWVEPKSGTGFASITVELNQNSRGKGIGTVCFQRACELSRYDEVFAEMRKSNIASQIAAKRGGFKPVKGYKGGQMRMVWRRKKPRRKIPDAL